MRDAAAKLESNDLPGAIEQMELAEVGSSGKRRILVCGHHHASWPAEYRDYEFYRS
jgi:hypothetical protein